MSSNILPPRKKRALAPNSPPEPTPQPMGAKKPRKTNMGNVMRMKNRRMSSPKV